MKLLLVRLDKIGDLVSTLPADEAFYNRTLPNGEKLEIEWVVAKGLGFLTENADPPRKAYEISLGQDGPFQFREVLQSVRPDAVLIFYGPAWAYWEAWRARVPRRIGRSSRWFSFFLLTHGLRQSRSRSLKHEADYNFELAHFAGRVLGLQDASTMDLPTPILRLRAPRLNQIFDRLLVRPQDYIVIHPGMAGSALNWPLNHYESLMEQILAQNPQEKIVITGTSMDQAWTSPLLARFKNEARVISAVEALNLRELLYLLQNAKAVVVPSTGVAHLAASLGTPTFAIYSPLRAHSSRRWGPRGPHVQIFEVPATSDLHLVDPMQLITPDQILQNIKTGELREST